MPEKKEINDAAKMIAEWKAKRINMLDWYLTLGCYDKSSCSKQKAGKKQRK